MPTSVLCRHNLAVGSASKCCTCHRRSGCRKDCENKVAEIHRQESKDDDFTFKRSQTYDLARESLKEKTLVMADSDTPRHAATRCVEQATSIRQKGSIIGQLAAAASGNGGWSSHEAKCMMKSLHVVSLTKKMA